jgi:hypothetical protein
MVVPGLMLAATRAARLQRPPFGGATVSGEARAVSNP